MAKIAQCGYGSAGQGLGKTTEGYSYVVNDNVRTGDKLQVISTSRKGNKFPTTAVPLHTYKLDSVKGQQAKAVVQDKLLSEGKDDKLTNVYSGKELRAKGSKITPEGQQSQYTMATRSEAMKVYQNANPQTQISEKTKQTYGLKDSFDSYSNKFMNKGDK